MDSIERKNSIAKGFKIQKNSDGTWQHFEKGGKKTGIYTDTSENRKMGRVGQSYKKDKKEETKETPPHGFTVHDKETFISPKGNKVEVKILHYPENKGRVKYRSFVGDMKGYAYSSKEEANESMAKFKNAYSEMGYSQIKPTYEKARFGEGEDPTGTYKYDTKSKTLLKKKEEDPTSTYKYDTKIKESDIKAGAKFKGEDGNIFVIDKVTPNDKIYGTLVESSLEGGAKGNYRDSIDEFVEFMNEEGAKKIKDYKQDSVDYSKEVFNASDGRKAVVEIRHFPENKGRMKYRLFVNDMPGYWYANASDADESMGKMGDAYAGMGYDVKPKDKGLDSNDGTNDDKLDLPDDYPGAM